MRLGFQECDFERFTTGFHGGVGGLKFDHLGGQNLGRNQR